jgi:hypothetical protein
MKKDSRTVFYEKLKALEYRVKNLSIMLEMTGFNEKLDALKEEVKNKEDGKTEVNYNIFIPKLKVLDKCLTKLYVPAFEVARQTKVVEKGLDEFDEIIKDINIKEAISLVKATNSLDKLHWDLFKKNDHNYASDIFKVVYNAEKVIYKEILHEAAIDKKDTYNCVMSSFGNNIQNSIREMVCEDVKELPEEIVNNAMEKHPYQKPKNDRPEIEELVRKYYPFSHPDYFNEDIIYAIAKQKYNELNTNYEDRKKNAAMTLLNHFDQIKNEKQEADRLKIERKRSIRKRNGKMALSATSLLAYLSVPILILCASLYTSTKLIKEHQRTTKQYDAITQETLEEKTDFTFSNESKINIKVVGEWKENRYGPGYVRYNQEYEYKTDQPIEEFKLEDIMDVAKYLKGFTETRLTLDSETTDVINENDGPKTIVTETIIDNGVTRPSGLGWLIGGGAAIILILLYVKACDGFFDAPGNILEAIREAKEQTNGVIEWKVLKERYEEIGGKKVKFTEEHKLATDRYDIPSKLSPEVINEVKHYVYK